MTIPIVPEILPIVGGSVKILFLLNLGKKDKHPIYRHAFLNDKTSIRVIHLTNVITKYNSQAFLLKSYFSIQERF